MAVSRWIAGEGMEARSRSGRRRGRSSPSWPSSAPRRWKRYQKRCFAWRNVMAEVLHRAPRSSRAHAEALLGVEHPAVEPRSISLVRMCGFFETERRRPTRSAHAARRSSAFLATHDPLTGLPNRTLILDRVEQMLVRSRRSKTPVAALFVDLDNFKSINDTLGHGVGDELLQAVAARLDSGVRATDALGRLGGDEFVVVSEELTLEVGPELIAERLLEALEAAVPARRGQTDSRDGDGEHRDLGGSPHLRGGSPARGGHRDVPREVGRQAWLRGVRGRHAAHHANRMELEMDLREALEKDEFFLAYQPTLDLSDMTPTGVEALIRWKPPGARRRATRRLHPAARGDRDDRRDRQVGSEEACAQGAAWRGPDIRSAWPSTSPGASSTPIS